MKGQEWQEKEKAVIFPGVGLVQSLKGISGRRESKRYCSIGELVSTRKM